MRAKLIFGGYMKGFKGKDLTSVSHFIGFPI